MAIRNKAILLILILALLPLSGWAADGADENAALDRGLRNDEPLSLTLVEKADDSGGDEKAETLKNAIKHSPDLPGLYFKLSWASLPDIFKSVSYCSEGLKSYKRNFWWSVSLSGLLLASSLISFYLALAITAFIRFSLELPLITHDMNEDKKRLAVPALIILLSLTSPVFAISGSLMLCGFYMKKTGKLVVILSFIPILLSPVILRTGNMLFSASTPEMRAIAAVNEGRDNKYAIETLSERDDFESRLSLAIALKREGRLEESEAVYKELISLRPASRLHIDLGNAYVAMGMGNLAIEEYKKAAELEPSATVYYNMSQIYRDKLDFKNGDKFYDDAVRINGDQVSAFTKIANRNPNRFVIDETLSGEELWGIAAKRSKDVLKITHLAPMLSSILGAALLALFIVMDSITANKAYRCSDCGKVLCPACSDSKLWGARCGDCYKLFKEETRPQAKVKRMLKSNEQKDKMRNTIKILSFAPPGIALIYAGRMFAGFLFLWAVVFCITALILNPLLSTGMASFSHSFLTLPLILIFLFLYIISFMFVSRRLESGWL